MKQLILLLAIMLCPSISMAAYCTAVDVDGSPQITRIASTWKTLLPHVTLGNNPPKEEVAGAGAYVLVDAIPDYDSVTHRLTGPVATWTAGPSVTRTWTAERIPWAERVAAKIQQVKAWCIVALAAPVTSSALGTPHSYRSEGDYMTYVLAGLVAGQSMYLPVIIDGKNVMELHTIQQIQTLFADFSTAKTAAGVKQGELFARAEACTEDNDSCLSGIIWGNDSP